MTTSMTRRPRPLGQDANLGISPDGKFFTLNGEPTFLYGVSYYGAQSISNSGFRTADLDDMAADGFNWMRVWVYWQYENRNVSVVEPNGAIRNPYMDRLKALISECNERNIIIDVSMTRGEYPFPSNQTEHLACARTLAGELKPYRNVYIDVANERDVQDARHVSLNDVGELINAIKVIDPDRLCTASSVPTSPDDLDAHFRIGRCDFICPHLGRHQGSSAQTIAKIQEFAGWMEQRNFRAPIHLQEPFRRGYRGYNPGIDDFLRDCTGAKIAEAAGWCLHNGSNKFADDNRPFRCFLMTDTEGRLYSQWDEVEQKARSILNAKLGGVDPNVRRYHAKYPEQLAHQIGRIAGDVWMADVSQDSEGFLNYGPYLNTMPAGNHVVSWRMKIDTTTGPDDEVLTLDVFAGGTFLGETRVKRQDFLASDEWQDFSIRVTSAGQKMVEFRSYWHAKATIYLDSVTLSLYQETDMNQAPAVSAGQDQIITLPDNSVELSGTVRDDNLPERAGEVTVKWTKQSGPGSVIFSNADALNTTATFSQGGMYVLRLTADDSELMSYADVTITINAEGAQQLVKTYQGARDFHHQYGAPLGEAWRGDITKKHSFLAFGPYDTSLPGGPLTARFFLRVDDNVRDDGYVCILDIHDTTTGRILGNLLLTRKDWNQSGVFQGFDLQFAHTAGHSLEFRTYYLEYALLDLEKVEVWTT